MWLYLLAGFIGMCLGAYVVMFAKVMTYGSMVEEVREKCIRCQKDMCAEAIVGTRSPVSVQDEAKNKKTERWMDAHGL